MLYIGNALRKAGAMSSISNSPSLAKILAAGLRANNEIRPVMLLGAGRLSDRACIAAEAVKRIAKVKFIRHELGGRVHASQVKYSQWMPWPAQHFFDCVRGAAAGLHQPRYFRGVRGRLIDFTKAPVRRMGRFLFRIF
jgi:hypothetical protein